MENQLIIDEVNREETMFTCDCVVANIQEKSPYPANIVDIINNEEELTKIFKDCSKLGKMNAKFLNIFKELFHVK